MRLIDVRPLHAAIASLVGDDAEFGFDGITRGESLASQLTKLQWQDQRERPSDEAILAEVERLYGLEKKRAVDAERDRRIAKGVTVHTSQGQSIPVDTRHETDFRNINGLSAAALVRQNVGDTTPFTFRGADNKEYNLIPAEMIQLGMQALAHVDAHYKAAWAIKDMDLIPADLEDDSYWPQMENK